MIVVIANGNLEAAYVIDSFKEDKHNKIIVINSDKEVAEYLMKRQHVSVYVGNPWRIYALEEAGIYDADLFISLSDNDTDNYVSCILAKKVFNVRKCICVVKNPDNVEIYKKLGIDSVISSTYLLTQNIKTESLEGNLIRSMNLDSNKIVMVEATLLSKYRICNKAIMDIHFPSYANIAYIMRDNEFIIPKGNVVLKPRDTLVIACDKADEDSLKKYLTQRASARDLQKNIASQIEKSLVKIKNTEVKEETPLPKETEEAPKVVEEAPLPQEEKEATPVANKSEKKKVAPKKTTKKTSSTNKKKTI
ncbi:MAG: TrkA family potassium uptake protein [Bacilli bacterium]|nr:TrkA family potassium uptake protein [Bacilli bacterium]